MSAWIRVTDGTVNILNLDVICNLDACFKEAGVEDIFKANKSTTLDKPVVLRIEAGLQDMLNRFGAYEIITRPGREHIARSALRVLFKVLEAVNKNPNSELRVD